MLTMEEMRSRSVTNRFDTPPRHPLNHTSTQNSAQNTSLLSAASATAMQRQMALNSMTNHTTHREAQHVGVHNLALTIEWDHFPFSMFRLARKYSLHRHIPDLCLCRCNFQHQICSFDDGDTAGRRPASPPTTATAGSDGELSHGRLPGSRPLSPTGEGTSNQSIDTDGTPTSVSRDVNQDGDGGGGGTRGGARVATGGVCGAGGGVQLGYLPCELPCHQMVERATEDGGQPHQAAELGQVRLSLTTSSNGLCGNRRASTSSTGDSGA